MSRNWSPGIIAMSLTAVLAPASLVHATDFEIAPLAGYRFGGQLKDSSVDENRDIQAHSSFGLALNLAKTPDTQWELTYSRESTSVEALSGAAAPGSVDLTVDYLQVGGTYFFSEEGHEGADPYVVGGLGVTHFNPTGAGLEDRYEPSLNVGLGLRVPLTPKVALRLEGRGYVTFVDTKGSIFCKSDAAGAACTIHARASGLWQIEALVGIAFRL
jgi:opacity protein-like surface antigen